MVLAWFCCYDGDCSQMAAVFAEHSPHGEYAAASGGVG